MGFADLIKFTFHFGRDKNFVNIYYYFVIIFINAIICYANILHAPAQADTKDTQKPVSNITSSEPRSIWVVTFVSVRQAKRIPHMKDEELVKLRGLSEQNIKGITPRIPWSVLNPEKDKFDWAPLDKITELSKKYKKKVAIRVSAAASIDATSEWLWNEIEWWSCRGKKETELNKLRVPKVWDKNFVAAREKLIKAMAQRYDNNETVQRITIDDLALDNEMDYIREDRMSAEVLEDFEKHNFYTKEIIVLLLYYNKNFSTIIGFQMVAPDNMEVSNIGKAFDIALRYPVTYVEVISGYWNKDHNVVDEAVKNFIADKRAEGIIF